MYVRSLEIKNIRSIEQFKMTFPEGKEAGWHVLIGDNGSGKSTIIRSSALAMLDISDINAARQNWDDWLNIAADLGSIELKLVSHGEYEFLNGLIQNRITFEWEKYDDGLYRASLLEVVHRGRKNFTKTNYSTTLTTTILPPPPATAPPSNSKFKKEGWFSVAYGPFRRFTGGNEDKEKLFLSNPRLGAHLSAFGEDVVLSEALSYIRELYIKQIDGRFEEKLVDKTLDYLKEFINKSQLLPNKAALEKVTYKDGPLFRDGNNNLISATQMSDGYRSILSMTFELIRQLVRVYDIEAVFDQVKKGNMIIDLPGVVLIDEIDAHLHPTWQTRIGQWFTKYFPNLQFIVTTHSPLVCRASEKGSIWRLAAPGSNQESGEVAGLDRDRLIYGNVLDAYSTEAFGQDVERSDQSKEKLERLAHLSQLNAYGKISAPEKEEMQDLRKILITDDTTEF